MPLKLALASLLIAGLACQNAAPPAGAADPTSDPAEEALLFQDDFSDASGEWDLANSDESEIWIGDGLFHITVHAPEILVWSAAGQTFEDVRIEVEAEKLDGPDAAEYGIVCRYFRDENGDFNFYYFVIAGDRYAAISKVEHGEQASVSRHDLKFEEINRGDAANHITAECIGNQLTLYVNRSQILVVADGTFSEGDVGLIATTYDEGEMQVQFDNFRVYDR